jgi:membrane-bound metal-dependent hydrolase YbcI (DUF457 family)
MTGKGHTWVGLATSIAVYKFTKDMSLTGYIAVLGHIFGATAPDWLEIRVKSGEGTKTLIKHRTITHWLFLWVALYVFTTQLIAGSFALPVVIPNFILELVLGFSIGGLLHLLTDLPNPAGIPIITPSGKHRFSLNLWKSGKNEVAITVVALLLSLWYAGLLEFNHYAVTELIK